MIVRIFLVLLAASLAYAQTASHPSWWKYASPDSTALIGIQWNQVRDSPFAASLATELSPRGWLGFPDLEFLGQHAERILIASPYLMAIEFGSFPEDVVRTEAAAKGLKRSSYKDVELWVTPAAETLSLARISEQLVILAHLPTLRDAIDRSLDTEAKPEFSPLFARAAQHSYDHVWVVSGPLPDPVVGRFVPLKIPAVSFDGGLSVNNGLHLSATLEIASAGAVDKAVDQVWKAIDPKLFENAQMFTDDRNIMLKIELTAEQWAAAVKPLDPPVVAVVAPTPPKPVRPQGPGVVKISGLEGGPREITVK